MAAPNLYGDTWLVVPAYNEGPVIAEVITNTRKTFPNVVVVDDCCSDDSGAQALAAGAHVLRHPINLGQGAALQTGIDFAVSQGAKFIATFDADGQHRVGDLRGMVARLAEDEKLDIVIGSRFLGDATSVPAGRRLLLKAARLFTRIVSGINLTDAHNGLRVFRARTAGKIKIRQNRMAHASEIVHQLKALDLVYEEFPVTIDYTEHSMQKGQRWWSSFAILRDLLVNSLTP